MSGAAGRWQRRRWPRPSSTSVRVRGRVVRRRRLRVEHRRAPRRLPATRALLPPSRVVTNWSRFLPLDPVREAGARTDNALSLPGRFIASSHRAAPARGGALADERRVVADDEVGRRRACTSQVASFAAGVANWRSNGERSPHTGVLIATFRCTAPARCGAFADERRAVAATTVGECGRSSNSQGRSSSTGGRAPGRVVRRGRAGVGPSCRSIRFESLAFERINARFTPACSSPPSVAMRPRVAARSPMSGASLRRRRRARADAKGSGQSGAVGVDERAPAWPRRSRRACRCGALAGVTVRKPGARTDGAPSHAALIAAFHRNAPARSGAFADAQRVVAGDGGRVCHRRACASRSRRSPRAFARLEFERATRSVRRRAHRHLRLRCARALRRVRR